MENMLRFDLPTTESSIIKVIGVGGGGGNAVNHMFKHGIKGVDFYICNTDSQALGLSSVPNKIQLGHKGLGAGSNPLVGRESALEKADEITRLFDGNTSMLFITAGMGGGTGTGAAPVIAKIASELGILTVGIVTRPFYVEGRKRQQQADAGIEELKKYVDSLLVINNDKLRELGKDVKLSEAFAKADNILTTAAKGIAEIITVTGYINVDFEDVKTAMLRSGKAVMGAGKASGDERAMEAVKMALSSPLLDETDIGGAKNILVYIASGVEEITLDEVMEITEFILDQAGPDADLKWGNGTDESLGDAISITLIATGFEGKKEPKIIHNLSEQEIAKAVAPPVIQEYASEIKLVKNTPVEQKVMEENLRVVSPDFLRVEPVNNLFSHTDNQVQSEEEEKKTDKVEFTAEGEESKANYDPEFEIVFPSNDEISSAAEKQAASQLEDQQEKQRQDRINKLKSISVTVNAIDDIEELERQPAYLRRQVEFSKTVPSENPLSRYTLSHDKNNKTELRESNSFLHDNVD